MGSPAILFESDERERRLAIDPTLSVSVQAPAGSGKTELLIQRFLRLLATVEKPEAIVAITFTRKAAGEMLDRILGSLRRAEQGQPAELPPALPHEQLTFDLAKSALSRDREQGWDLLSNPNRLRVQTIDSLCSSIAGQMPWLARLGFMPRIEEDAQPLYMEAARRTLQLVEQNTGYREPIETLLLHLDNNAARVQKMIADMLAARDQWIQIAVQTDEDERVRLEAAMSRALCDGLQAAERLVPADVRGTWADLAHYAARNRGGDEEAPEQGWPPVSPAQRSVWLGLANLVLKESGEWRKKGGLNTGCGFPSGAAARKEQCAALISRLQPIQGLREALDFVRVLPPAHYTDDQWRVMRALLASLKIAVAELLHVFREEGAVDFAQVGMAASEALGRVDNPTELAFRLDSRIEHLLVDEFQDTSHRQFELLEKLVAEWQPDDGRTLFVVGDPMQSIYRFRQAEVGLFLEAQNRGIGGIRLVPLQLKANYRSVKGIVDRVNQIFSGIFPETNETATGAIQYSRSHAADANAVEDDSEAAVTIHPFVVGEDRLEADTVVDLVKQAHRDDPQGSIAILVRARTHLPAIVEALKTAGVGFRAVNIDPLSERTVVLDLLSLTRAMLHAADRISWLAILRAPWCGLTLTDLASLAAGKKDRTIWELLEEDPDGLSDDGRRRAARLRAVLAEAFEERGRWPLRRWVERAWSKLAGPACLEDDGDLQDALAYFERLEDEQVGCDLPDFDGFRQRLSALYAKPSTQAPEDQSPEEPSPKEQSNAWLQVMTIHKAKGLQFDTVILPGLGRSARNDELRLFLFHQWISSGHSSEKKKGTDYSVPTGELLTSSATVGVDRAVCPLFQERGENEGEIERLRLLAPIQETGSDGDPAYEYLRQIENKKDRYERVRQLYVAATRAKKRLHLLGHVAVKSTGEPRVDGRSMLFDLYPALTPAEADRFAARAAGAARDAIEQPLPPAYLRRLPETWTAPAVPTPVEWRATAEPSTGIREPSFEWVGDSLRHAGTVVHAFLERMTGGDGRIPELAAIRRTLAHAGVPPAEIDWTAELARKALERMQTSPRGRWILAAHNEARSEYAIAGVLDGHVVRGTVDRTFVDERGVRWIIDYKTSAHEGGGLGQFLDDQQRRYRDQLERYARLLEPLGQPVRLGLYFPLLDAWREWSRAS